VAVRAALGAPRLRIARVFLTESAVLSLMGGAAGVLLAWWLVKLVPLFDIERMPSLLLGTRIDPAALAFTLAVSLATGLIAGAVPAFSAARANVHETLKDGGRSGLGGGRKRLWNLLVVSETALALLLLVGATLLVRSFLYLRDVAPGFRVGGLMTASLSPARVRYPAPEPLTAFYAGVL
jgi:hypothetical protein